MPGFQLHHENYLSKLADEVFAAYPALMGILIIQGPRRAREVGDPDNPNLYIMLDAEPDDTITFIYPDTATVDQPGITAIVNAHDPTPPVVIDPFAGLDDTTLDNAIAAADAVDTLAKAKAVLQALVRNQAKMARYLRRQAGHA